MSDYISEDILVVILKYLPVKTLLQFRCVCNGWKQLIDSPAFVQHHLSIQNPTFIIQHGPGRKCFVLDPLHLPRHSVKTLNKPIPTGEFHLFGTHHGIVCLFDMKNLFLWNPSTHRILRIHLPIDLKGSFQLRASWICYGFWIHPVTKEYKIIVVQSKPQFNCLLYSNTVGRNWSAVPTQCKLKHWSRLKDGPPVLIRDVAYWVGCLDESAIPSIWARDHIDNIILAFDFIHDCFDVIELPNPNMMGYYNTDVFRWKDALSLVCCGEKFTRCKMFLRTEDSWTPMFDFEVRSQFLRVFWATEDLEKVKKRGKGKRKREAETSDGGSVGVAAQDDVRVLATTVSDSGSSKVVLVLNGTKSGCKSVRKGLARWTDVIMAYDFVESLLFP